MDSPANRLRLGPIELATPVVLAPMAGITDHPFREVCRGWLPEGGRRAGAGTSGSETSGAESSGAEAAAPAALFVSEMVTARGLVEGHRRSRELARFGPTDAPRSLQLYGTDPAVLAGAVALAVRPVAEGGLGAEHVDLNFGCPMPKITSKGGGAAVPLRPALLASLVRAAVEAAAGAGRPVPVTVKTRLGIDDAHLTYREAGAVAEGEGAAAIGLHARTAAQLYEGAARWEAIADLASRVAIPVLGNGDLWRAADAVRMLRETGCAGVIVGRGCLGRPWLFRDLAAVLGPDPCAEPPPPPRAGAVVATLLEHARLRVAWVGREVPAMRKMRKLARWYAEGLPPGAVSREALGKIERLADLERALAGVDPEAPFPEEALRSSAARPRAARAGRQRRVRLPEGFLPGPGAPVGPDPLSLDGG